MGSSGSIAGTMQLGSGVTPPSSTITLKSAPPSTAARGWLLISAFTTNCELRAILSISGTTVTLAQPPLRKTHNTDDMVLWTDAAILSVDVFGAVGDGVADDTLAIQAALDAAGKSFPNEPPNLGGKVLFPPGRYYVNGELFFDSNVSIIGLAGRGAATITQHGGGIRTFQARTRTTATTNHVFFHNLTINNVLPVPPGAFGIDLSQVSLSGIYECSFRYHERGIYLSNEAAPAIGGGYYNTVQDCEIASCTYGIYFGTAGNSETVRGGRINGNTTGIYIGSANANWIETALESNGIGIEFASGATKNVVVGGRFEGNNGSDIADKGAIVFRAGATNNAVLWPLLSGGTDRVYDFDGTNIVHALGFSYRPSTLLGGGLNHAANALMDRDGNNDGIADAWTPVPVPGAGMTFSIDRATKVYGLGSQKWQVDAAGSISRDLVQTIYGLPVGELCVLTCRVQTDFDNGWNLRVGNVLGGTEYANVPIRKIAGQWHEIVAVFKPTPPPTQPTQDHVAVYFHPLPAVLAPRPPTDPPANLWIDFLKVEAGRVPTGASQSRLIFGNWGPRSQRPEFPATGEMWYDTTLLKPIWFDGTSWRDATGAITPP